MWMAQSTLVRELLVVSDPASKLILRASLLGPPTLAGGSELPAVKLGTCVDVVFHVDHSTTHGDGCQRSSAHTFSFTTTGPSSGPRQ